MAAVTFHITETKRLSPREREVTYCDPASPNVCYTVRCGMSAFALQAAIRAHVRQRKAAGLDYPGKPGAAPSTVTVTV